MRIETDGVIGSIARSRDVGLRRQQREISSPETPLSQRLLTAYGARKEG
jgi:hypothetical protein